MELSLIISIRFMNSRQSVSGSEENAKSNQQVGMLC